MINSCLICDIDTGKAISENELAYAVHDGYPVTEFHALICGL
jgi:diadenosine tetraphosphate (Ap4A) HIT family hydrolase